MGVICTSQIPARNTPPRQRLPGWLVAALLPLGLLCQSVSAAPTAQSQSFYGHSAWVYDTLRAPGQPRSINRGHFIQDILRFNRGAEQAHQIRSLYVYHGSMEMYCPNNRPAACRAEHLKLSLATPARGQPSSASHYRRGLAENNIASVAIIDGVTNGDYAGSLKGMDDLSPEMARRFADTVSDQLCADPNIDGVQFDLEPLNLNRRNGQYYFYQRIAERFAGEAGQCRSDSHPKGRYFSVFAPVHALNPESASAALLSEILGRHGNGYLIAPIYDLDSAPLGELTPPARYQTLAHRQIKSLNDWATQAGVPFKVGIPAAASVHEYVRCEGPPCKGRGAPGNQLDYVRPLLAAMDQVWMRDNPLFMGNVIWAWSRGISHGGASFHPDRPTPEMQRYLQQHL
ncbi:hypothetical protein GCM10027567_29880 [Spongiibacter taiwanensis]